MSRIGNTTSQHEQPDDNHLEFYVEENKKKGGENKTMDNNQQMSTVVQPSANPSTGFSATAPDPDGKIASQKFETPVLQKAIDALEEAMQSLEDIYLEKSDFPNVSRPSAVTTVNNETEPTGSEPAEIITKKTCTCPNCTDPECSGGVQKSDEPDAGRASSVSVQNETEPTGGEPSPIIKAIQTEIQKAKDALDAVNAELTGKDTYANQNHSTNAPSKDETTEVTKAAQCCDNACGKCKGPGCGCCADCKKIEKAADSCNCGKEDCEKCMGMNKAAETDSDTEPDDDEDDLQKKEFSSARRKQLAREGKAMPDGSYPIENEQDLKNAIRAWGRGGAKPADKEHIVRRAKSIGKYDLIPDDWKKDMKKSVWGGSFFPAD